MGKIGGSNGNFSKKAAMVCGDGFITNNVECFHKTGCLEIDFMFKSMVRIPQQIDLVSRSDWSKNIDFLFFTPGYFGGTLGVDLGGVAANI